MKKIVSLILVMLVISTSTIALADPGESDWGTMSVNPENNLIEVVDEPTELPIVFKVPNPIMVESSDPGESDWGTM